MRQVKGGCFMMGNGFSKSAYSERPLHEVCLKDFLIGEHEVTQAEWVSAVGDNPSYFKACPKCPVESVTYADIEGFIAKLRVRTGQQYRLPTEAEWEYAARGGGRTEKYSGGISPDPVGWHSGNSGGAMHPVCGKKKNSLGICDMSGSVWELVSDWFDETYYERSPKDNPTGPDTGDMKVGRGGSFDDDAELTRTSVRFAFGLENKGYALGFRLARDVKPKAK